MSGSIEFNRNGCLLQGAVSVIQAIGGAAPIIHSTAGCGVQGKYMVNPAHAYAADDFAVSSTNVIEKQIVFGGTSRLREEIKNTVKVIEADLYVVLSGCATEIVGDDIGAMTKEAADQGYPVIHISTPGFKGHSFDAYGKVTRALIDTLSGGESEAADKNLVNIFGISPNQDPYWEGNLGTLDALLRESGFVPNLLFGFGSSVENWKRIGSAGINLAFSGGGLEIARYLQKKFGTRYISVEAAPLGIGSIQALLQSLAEAFPEKQEQIKTVEHRQRDEYLYHLSRLAPYYYRYRIQKEAALVGPEQTVVPVAKFLENDFGQIIKALIITDQVDQTRKERIAQSFDHAEIFCSEDGKQIENKLRQISPEIILGSQLEKRIAEELHIPLLYISLPAEDRLILRESLCGAQGSLALLEQYSNFFIGRP